MDPKELRGLMEAYSEVYAPQEVDEAVKGEPSERRRDLAAERRAGHRPLPAKEGEKYASHKLAQMAYAKRKRMGEEVEIFDVVLEFLQVEGYAETLEEAEWIMANVIDEEAIDIILGEAITSEKGKAKAAEMIAKRSTPSGRAKAGQGASVAAIKHISRANVDNLGGTPPNPKIAKNPVKSRSYGGTGNKAARRAAEINKEEFELWVDALVEEGYDLSGYTWDEMYEFYLDEAQEARNNPEKYEAGEKKKYAPVRGERTPMPPRGDKRREDFEKWYAKQMGR